MCQKFFELLQLAHDLSADNFGLTKSPGHATMGRGVRDGERQLQSHAHLENPTDKTDTPGVAASDPIRCAHCGAGERAGAMIVPFGTDGISHAWLHSEGWRAGYTKRNAAGGAGKAR